MAAFQGLHRKDNGSQQSPPVSLGSTNAHNSFNDNSITDNSKHISHNFHGVVDNRTSTTVKQIPRGLDILREYIVATASYDSVEHQSAAPCLPGTREVVLNRIYNWVDCHDDSAVYWLHGPGGAGKTTIATTVAAKYAEENRLAGSFFFSRVFAHHPGRRSTKGVFATIAYQNSTFHPFLKKRIERILNSDPFIIDKSFEIQLDHLIVGPIRINPFIPPIINAIQLFFELCATFPARIKSLDNQFHQNAMRPLYSNPTMRITGSTICELSTACTSCIIFNASFATITQLVFVALILISILANPTVQNIVHINTEAFLNPKPMVVVIDALDECSEPVDSLIKVLAHAYRDSPPPIRFLLTSRPDEAIEGKFRLYSDRTHFVNLMDFRAHDDIRASLRDGFDRLNIELSEYLMSIEKPWPSPADIESLVEMSEGLFIYASTLLKFIQGESNSNQDSHPAKRLKMAMQQHDGLDGLYRQVLQEAPYSFDLKFKRILGALCFLRSQLDLKSLATFLQLDGPAELRQILRGCKSILRIPQTDTAEITFFHASLYDFLTSKKRCQADYYIEGITQHLFLLDDSIQIVINELHIFCRGPNGGPVRPPMAISHTLRYALRNWHLHLLEIYRINKHHHNESVINLLKAHFDGQRYEHVFLYFLNILGDTVTDWRWIFPDNGQGFAQQIIAAGIDLFKRQIHVDNPLDQ